ncbi:S1C family serine protease [[Clostridium] polysaccharolyticum]|uniref:Serine protease Do n=1 Tax=[Clostridium] polysaccharolyticum TaxID=29364 RepID=A0A1I0ENF1_9FIRM|nr:trypsin-like peptidase domain-containing protein [[Clostridium] polysaccharolyticum]SET46788.1 serine protease Do [[Clostridium] polysaccharolyticum]
MNKEFFQDNTEQEIDLNKNRKKMNPLAKKTGILILSGLILGTTAGGAFSASTYFLPKKTIATEQIPHKTSASSNTALTKVLNTSSSASKTSVQDIAEKGMPSIVAITNKGVTETMTLWGNMQQPSESCGSGIIIGETDKELLVVTNHHVIEGSQTLTVVFSFDEDNKNADAVEAHVKGYDSNKDLAVISISKDKLKDDVLSKISIAAIGDSAKLGLGEQVVAIGNALGYGQSVTTGIVSALNRQIGSDKSNSSDNSYIQTDAAINPGNSGGALFNMNGELVGINTAKIASEQIEGMGYAIPISDVHDLIENLMNQTTRTQVVDAKNRGYLGISGTDVSSEVTETYSIPQGVYIAEVSDNSAAAKAGLKKGYVLTKFDGKTISSSSELKTLVAYYKAGETVTVTAQVPENSEYKEKEFKVTLGKNENATDDNVPNETPSDGTQNQQEPANPFEEFQSPFENPFGDQLA